MEILETFTIEYNVSCKFFKDALLLAEEVSFYFLFVEHLNFFNKQILNFWNPFSASIETIIYFYCFIY